ncbi:MAG TPA: hypothetical protein ENG31_01830 [Candidatus Thorarchaeota archaeon]|nr:MAG: hypothetical protein DRO73_04060 [Candidatus Thorarchaeota archaeon]RLI62781.1 MAG: hypothetical protein DRO93_00320 [Candidatus Thorarchaeota archaeon]HDD67347.1 hypothetical protein [Candidatus Thorarchaeota archaeon]
MTGELNETLQDIREIVGVENVVLVQRDGLPVASAGVWFSKEEVFSVASSTCAIFGVARLVHGNFRYLLMESETSKVFLASLPNYPNYFLTVTTAPRVNLAALLIEMKQNLSRIAFLLRQHLEGKLPPLRSYSPDDTQKILQGFAVVEGAGMKQNVSYPIITLDRATALSLRNIMRQISDTIPNTESVFFALNGGIRISLGGFTDDRLAAMSFALYDASERVIRTLRNSSLERVLCETETGRHFIYSVPNGVFSLQVTHGGQKLGLMRLLLKHYITEASRLLESVSASRAIIPDDLRELLLMGVSGSDLLLPGGEP